MTVENSELWVEIVTSVNILLLGACGFFINKTWDRSKEDKDEAKQDRDDLRAQIEGDRKSSDEEKRQLLLRIDKNSEHIASFRSEIGIISNDLVNKADFLGRSQVSLQSEVKEVGKDVKELNIFVRDHFGKQVGRN